MRGAGRLVPLLLLVPFLDELSTGVPTVGAPGIQESFGVSHGMAAGWVLTAGGLLSVFVLPPLFLLMDRYGKRRFVVAGLLGMALGLLLFGLAPSYWWALAIAFVMGPANGCAVSGAQAAVIDAAPRSGERSLTRWTLYAGLGDLAAPALFAALAGFTLGWRAAAFVCAGVLAVQALLVARHSFPRGPAAEEETVPLGQAFAAALANRRLLVWTLGVWLCSLLDELLVAFGALHLRDALGADATARGLLLMTFPAGVLLGLALTDRLLSRFDPLRLLTASTLCCGVAYGAWIFAPNLFASAAALFGVGVFVGPQYPLAQAQCYRALPGRTGTVAAIGMLLHPAEVALPLALGLLADTFGLVATLLLLAAQPIGLLVIALVSASGDPGDSLPRPQP